MLNRRGFLGTLLATAVLDPEKLLWIPGKKHISIPRPRPMWIWNDAMIRSISTLDLKGGFTLRRVNGAPILTFADHWSTGHWYARPGLELIATPTQPIILEMDLPSDTDHVEVEFQRLSDRTHFVQFGSLTKHETVAGIKGAWGKNEQT